MLPDFEIWLDHQLPAILAKRIKEAFGYKLKSSFILQSQTWSDWQIYYKAQEQQLLVILLSKDGDFSNIIGQKGVPPKLIKINTGNIRNGPLWQLQKLLLPEAVTRLISSDTEIIYIQNDKENS